ncbi:hypothetical protein [Hartmannibacter diazotrophicus]|nr:hypothetical protein [Hartmannibacter diazotrophicus]
MKVTGVGEVGVRPRIDRQHVAGRVSPASADKTTVGEERDRSEAAGEQRPESRALVVVEQPSVGERTHYSGNRNSSAPFLTQLIANRDGGSVTAERRVQRNDNAVAPRATSAYAQANRLSSRIEPGFLYAVSA